MEKFISMKMSEWFCNKFYVTAAIIDIDEFKNYNDLFGHVKGDECFIKVTNAIIKSFSNTTPDLFRFGGDEFIVIIEEPNLNVLRNYIVDIMKSINDEQIPITEDQNGPALSVSIGAKTLKVDENYSLTNHIDLADKYLYEVKKNNRNHAVLNSEIVKIN